MENLYKLMPYLGWMAILAAGLPYWMRTVCGGILLLPAVWRYWRRFRFDVAGFFAGLAVFALWIFPEVAGFVRTPERAAAIHPVVQLLGSAFVISAAEELFFRDFLYNWLLTSWPKWAAAAISLVLFAVEHDKYLCALAAGAVYLALYLKRGLASAIVAHATTNLALGLYVILTGSWHFW